MHARLSGAARAGYEGTLYTIDTNNSTVALQDVKSFGTEDRKVEGGVPGSNEIFDYIIFRGSDIKDLHVCETAADAPDADVESAARDNENVQSHLDGKTVRKVIVVPGRLINIVAG